MSSKHQSLGSPVSPLSSRQNSFSPSSQYRPPTTAPQHHKKSSPPTKAVSPLSAQFPDSPPTRSYLSPVSIASPELSFPPELLHHEHHPAPPTAPEVPQTVHLARVGTLHLQDHMPFKQPARITASTRFPSRKPVNESRSRPAAGNYPEDKEESGPSRSSFFPSSERPVTTYLADHQPHRLAAPAAPTILPITSTARPNPNPNNNSIKPTHHAKNPTFHSTNLQDIELGHLTSTTPTTPPPTTTKPAPVPPPTTAPCASANESETSSENAAAERPTTYEIKRQRRRLRNCIIGWVLCPALVGIIVVFAVLVIRANG